MPSSGPRPLAVITGASSGIGYELAKVFGEEGYDLLVAAEDAELDQAATIPGAFQAVYNASKSFVQSFAPALRNELKDTEVSITALMPRPTDTEFFEVADMEEDGKNTAVGTEDKDDPAQVARQGYDALIAGKERVVGGSLMNKVQVAVGGVVPDAIKAEMHRKMAEPGTGEED